MKTDNKITILLTTYNRAELLKRCLQSCFEQTDKNFDLIIIDNGSTDGTKEILDDIGIHDFNISIFSYKEVRNPHIAHQEGFDSIKTQWLTILCDDDWLANDYIEKGNAIIDVHACSYVVFGTAVVEEATGEIIKTHQYEPGYLDALETLCKAQSGQLEVAGISGFLFKKELLWVRKYMLPNGYFTDTLITLLAPLNSGTMVASGIGYYKTIWSGSQSHFSKENLLKYIEAMIEFKIIVNHVISENPLYGKFQKYLVNILEDIQENVFKTVGGQILENKIREFSFYQKIFKICHGKKEKLWFAYFKIFIFFIVCQPGIFNVSRFINKKVIKKVFCSY